MDNKITKRRLSDFLSYEWIVIIVVCIALIIAWEVVYAITSVKLTYGQKFKIAYDEYVDVDYNENIVGVTYGKKAFSYDVLSISTEGMSPGLDNELSIRYQTHDVDVLAVSCTERTSSDGEKFKRANSVVENMDVWSYEKAVCDGDKYLTPLLKHGVTPIQGYNVDRAYSKEDLDVSKIDELFLTRMKKDNRYRKQEEKEQGKILERQRIFKICEEVAFAKKLLRDFADRGIFNEYTRYTQPLEQNIFLKDETKIRLYEEKLRIEKQNNLNLYGKEKLSYGIRVDKLEYGDEYRSSQFFTVDGKAKEIVLLAFDFASVQPHLQFESLSFMNTVVRMCSWYGLA